MTRPSFPMTEDPELADMQTMVLLTSLVEQHGDTFGPTMKAALLHAARRLWEFWNDEDEDADEDGPLSVDTRDDPRPGPSSGVLVEDMAMFR